MLLNKIFLGHFLLSNIRLAKENIMKFLGYTVKTNSRGKTFAVSMQMSTNILSDILQKVCKVRLDKNQMLTLINRPLWVGPEKTNWYEIAKDGTLVSVFNTPVGINWRGEYDQLTEQYVRSEHTEITGLIESHSDFFDPSYDPNRIWGDPE